MTSNLKLLAIAGALMLGGCATTATVRNLQLQIDELAQNVHVNVNDLKKTDDDILNLVDRVERRTERTVNRLGMTEDARIANLESFKAAHDKRWPPPVKIKSHK